MVGDIESTSVRCSRDRLKITICGNDNNTEIFKTPVNRLYTCPKMTSLFIMEWQLWVSADHVLVKGLGSNRDQFLPPSLLQTVNETYEQGTTDTKSRSGQEGFMSLQSDNNYKIEIGEKKSFTLQQGPVISIIYVFHTNHILIFVAFDNLEESSLRSGLSSVWMKHADYASQEGRRYVIPWLYYLDFCCHMQRYQSTRFIFKSRKALLGSICIVWYNTYIEQFSAKSHFVFQQSENI